MNALVSSDVKVKSFSPHKRSVAPAGMQSSIGPTNSAGMELINNIGHFCKSVCPIVSTDIKFVEAFRHKEIQISKLCPGVANTNHRLFTFKRNLNDLCNKCR